MKRPAGLSGMLVFIGDETRKRNGWLSDFACGKDTPLVPPVMRLIVERAQPPHFSFYLCVRSRFSFAHRKPHHTRKVV